MANYVRSLSGLANDSLRTQRAKDLFAQNCAACHGGRQGKSRHRSAQSDRQDMALRLLGVDHRGDGNQGRQNQMPAFQEFLGDAKVHLLAAYVYSLSNKAEAAK